MKQTATCLLIGLVLNIAPAIAQDTTPHVLHLMGEGETLAAVAAQYMGSPDALDELVRFNQLANPASVKPGDLIAVPVGVRQQAMAALQQADLAVKEAVKAMAETYAPEEFAATKRSWTAARTSRAQASYDRTVALANLAVTYAQTARRLADERAPVQQDATIAALHGSADISAEGGTTWVPAKVGDKLPVKAELRTAGGSRVELALADGSTIQVLENSRFRIHDFIQDRRTQQRQSILDVLLGEIMGKVKPKATEDSTFRLRSGDAAISIRGTQVRIGTSEDETMRLSVLEGHTTVAAQSREADVPENFGTFARKGAPPATPQELLPPPVVQVPAGDAGETARQRVPFRWEPVDHPRTAGYLLEIALDPAFNQVLQKSQAGPPEWTSEALPEGDYLWRICTIDRNGLAGRYSDPRPLRVRLNLDIRLAPALEPYRKGDRLIVGPAYTYVAQPVREDTSVVALEYSVNAGPFTRYEQPFQLAAAGPNHVVARGLSEEGKTGAEQTIDVVLDNQPPRISTMLGAPEPHPDLGKAVTVTLQAKDDTALDLIEYSLNEAPFTKYSEPIVVSAYTTYDLTYRAVDVVGNKSEPRTVALQAEVAPR